MMGRVAFVLCRLWFHISNLSVNANSFQCSSIFTVVLRLFYSNLMRVVVTEHSTPKHNELKPWEIALPPGLIVTWQGLGGMGYLFTNTIFWSFMLGKKSEKEILQNIKGVCFTLHSEYCIHLLGSLHYEVKGWYLKDLWILL